GGRVRPRNGRRLVPPRVVSGEEPEVAERYCRQLSESAIRRAESRRRIDLPRRLTPTGRDGLSRPDVRGGCPQDRSGQSAGVKPTPISFSSSIAWTLFDALFFLLTAARPSSVTDSRPRKIARLPQSFHISMRCGNLTMMSVRV